MSVKCSDEEISRQQGMWNSGDRSRMENVKRNGHTQGIKPHSFLPQSFAAS